MYNVFCFFFPLPASADSHETTAKKSKTSVTKLDPSPQINGIKVYWEYEECRKWLPFSESLSELLTDRYNGGDTEVSLNFCFCNIRQLLLNKCICQFILFMSTHLVNLA